MLKKAFYPLLFGLVLLALVMNITLTSTKYLKGDGYEYLLMSESLSHHFSPEARVEDVHSLDLKIKAFGHKSPIDLPILGGYFKMLQGGPLNMGYFKAKNELYYSYHFFLYSLINVPALYLTELFSMAPVRSFLITNFIIFLSTLIFLYNTTLLAARERFFLIAFYIFSGTTYYMDWSHPEVFSASLLLIGLLYALRKCLVRGAFLIALAAQQNPPLAPLVLALLGWQGLGDLKTLAHSKEKLKTSLVLFSPLVLISLLLFASPLFYFLRFGTPSLIVSVGAASNQFISSYRLFSFFFDFNQGMIVAIPFVFLLGALSGLYWLFKPQRKNLLGIVLMLAATVLIAIPCLTTGNWNSGQSIFLRYAYWSAMPLGFAVMLLLNHCPARLFKGLMVVFLIGQSYLLLNYRISGREDTMQAKALSTYLVNHKPTWYNPVPPVFMKRYLVNATGAEGQAIYYYVNQEQRITKVLYQLQNEKAALTFCGNKTIAELKSQIGATRTEEHWSYLNALPADCHSNLKPGLYKI